MDDPSVSAAPPRELDRVFVLGEVDTAVLPAAKAVTRLSADAFPNGDRLAVDDAIRWASRPRARRERVLVMTDRDLFIPECASLFGFADTRRGVALVSTFRLVTPDKAQFHKRVDNAVAHEAGHLDGLKHCRGDCVMRPAATADELDSRPIASCGRCPRHMSLPTKIVLALALALAVTATAAVVSERQMRPRHPPALPPVFANAFAEFPRDLDDVFSRPMIVAAHVFGDAGADNTAPLSDTSLPPGLTTATVPQFAAAITSALFRTPDAEPIVHVHVLDLRPGAPSVRLALGCRTAIGTTAAYDVCRVNHGDADVHLVTPRAAPRVAIVFSPRASGRAMAARLAATVGTSAGLLRDDDLSAMISGLPATSLAGLTLQTLVVSNIHRVPESLDELATALLGSRGGASAGQVRYAMPRTIMAATYRTDNGPAISVVVGDYGNAASAWLGSYLLNRRLGEFDAGSTAINGVHARRLRLDSRHALVLRRGRFIIAAHADRRTEESQITRLAAAMQF